MATITLTVAATHAAQMLGVLDSGEGLSTQQIADALVAANNLIDSWAEDGLMIPSRLQQTIALAGGQQSYQINPKPLTIEAAAFRNASGPGGAVEVCSAAQWAQIADRQAQSYILRHLWYDRTATVYVSPVPQGGGLSLDLTVWGTPLAPFVSATTPLTLPNPGYARLIELGLAIELAPQYNEMPSQVTVQSFQDAIARVRNLNAQLLGVEPPSGQAGSMGPRGAVAPNPGNQ